MLQYKTLKRATLDIPTTVKKISVKPVGQTDGYDGHCLRAYSYFKEEMPDIDPLSVDSINSIKNKYGKIRDKSKAPTFLLTYGGTKIGLIKNLGFSPEMAALIENAYHELYIVSDQWVQNKLKQASVDGYITAAFGLRVRTPLLHKTNWASNRIPYDAQKEGRTAGNALGQSWCLLNNRAAIEFMEIVHKSKYRYDIRPCVHIHDAQYFIWKNDPKITKFVNDNLIKAMQWQDDPEIEHPTVKLGGELDIFYPSWAEGTTLQNNISLNEIKEIHNKILKKVV